MIQTPAIEKHVNFLVANWHSSDILVSEILPESNNKKWWQFWKLDADQKQNLQNVFRYMLEGIEDFVIILQKTYGNIGDHQEDIVNGVSTLYDNIVTLPLWLKPFNSKIKGWVLLIVPIVVDFLDNRTS
jgi:hypothetical protein